MDLTEIEKRLTALVAELRESCDGNLPGEDFGVHLEDIAHAIGLDDTAIKRILALDHLPSDEPLRWRLPAEVEVAITQARARNDHAGAMAAARFYYEHTIGKAVIPRPS